MGRKCFVPNCRTGYDSQKKLDQMHIILFSVPQLVYQRDVELNGVPGMRFVSDPNFMAGGRNFEPNRCFCLISPEPEPVPDDDEEPIGEGDGAEESSPTGGEATPTEKSRKRRRRGAEIPIEEKELNSCLPDGALDMSKCYGSPVILSAPHFLRSAKEFQDYPIGLSPEESKHLTAVDVEPVSGIPMRAAKRVQLNMFLKKIDDFDILKTVSEGLFPILWVEEGITLEGHSMEKLIAANRGLMILHALPWGLAGVGLLMALVGGAMLANLPGMLKGKSKDVKPPQSHYPSMALPNYRVSMGFDNKERAYVRKSMQEHAIARPIIPVRAAYNKY